MRLGAVGDCMIAPGGSCSAGGASVVLREQPCMATCCWELQRHDCDRLDGHVLRAAGPGVVPGELHPVVS